MSVAYGWDRGELGRTLKRWLAGEAWAQANVEARKAVAAAGVAPTFRDKYVNLRCDGKGDVTVRLKWAWQVPKAREALTAAGFAPYSVSNGCIAILVKVSFTVPESQMAPLRRIVEMGRAQRHIDHATATGMYDRDEG